MSDAKFDAAFAKGDADGSGGIGTVQSIVLTVEPDSLLRFERSHCIDERTRFQFD